MSGSNIESGRYADGKTISRRTFIGRIFGAGAAVITGQADFSKLPYFQQTPDQPITPTAPATAESIPVPDEFRALEAITPETVKAYPFSEKLRGHYGTYEERDYAWRPFCQPKTNPDTNKGWQETQNELKIGKNTFTIQTPPYAEFGPHHRKKIEFSPEGKKILSDWVGDYWRPELDGMNVHIIVIDKFTNADNDPMYMEKIQDMPKTKDPFLGVGIAYVGNDIFLKVYANTELSPLEEQDTVYINNAIQAGLVLIASGRVGVRLKEGKPEKFGEPAVAVWKELSPQPIRKKLAQHVPGEFGKDPERFKKASKLVVMVS